MSETIASGVAFPCPGCGKSVTVGETAEGEPVVFHPLPQCARVERVNTIDDAVAFMREARKLLAPEQFS